MYNSPEMKLFWNMMAERHRVYKKRTAGTGAPWTTDPILSKFKFTNVMRELDTGTRFVTDYIAGKAHECNLSAVDCVFNIMLYRMFNKIETVHYVMESIEYNYTLSNFDPTMLESLVRRYVKENPEEKVFTNAFIVSGFSHLPKRWDKISRVCYLLGELKKSILVTISDPNNSSLGPDNTMESMYKWMLEQNGYGPFLGYQCAVDVSYMHSTYGEDDFVVCGPGCKRGIDRLFPEQVVKEYGYEALNFWLRDNQYSFYEDYGIDHKELFDDRMFPYLTVMSIENLLCEFSKYMKVHNGEGRPRNKHDSASSQQRMASNKYSTWLIKGSKPFNVYSKLDMSKTVWEDNQ